MGRKMGRIDRGQVRRAGNGAPRGRWDRIDRDRCASGT
mgnify:CR=1 FL=1